MIFKATQTRVRSQFAAMMDGWVGKLYCTFTLGIRGRYWATSKAANRAALSMVLSWIDTNNAYNLTMSSATKTASSKSSVPSDTGPCGPQNDAEHELYVRIMQGIDSGPSQITSVSALTAELRARIHSKR